MVCNDRSLEEKILKRLTQPGQCLDKQHLENVVQAIY